MIAQIIDSKIDTADIFFLFAFILALVAAILYAVRTAEITRWAPVAGWLGASFAFLAFWVL